MIFLLFRKGQNSKFEPNATSLDGMMSFVSISLSEKLGQGHRTTSAGTNITLRVKMELLPKFEGVVCETHRCDFE